MKNKNIYIHTYIHKYIKLNHFAIYEKHNIVNQPYFKLKKDKLSIIIYKIVRFSYAWELGTGLGGHFHIFLSNLILTSRVYGTHFIASSHTIYVSLLSPPFGTKVKRSPSYYESKNYPKM